MAGRAPSLYFSFSYTQRAAPTHSQHTMCQPRKRLEQVGSVLAVCVCVRKEKEKLRGAQRPAKRIEISYSLTKSRKA
jgi:hypothetical protein